MADIEIWATPADPDRVELIDDETGEEYTVSAKLFWRTRIGGEPYGDYMLLNDDFDMLPEQMQERLRQICRDAAEHTRRRVEQAWLR